MKPEDLKLVVKEKYGFIAQNSQASCCGGGGCCSSVGNTVFSDSYTGMEGYNPDADFNLGCGLPTEFAHISPGDTVVDLGSGAGNDCFVARSLVGETGLVIGIDMTEAMIEKARQNAAKLKYSNLQFRLGDIENMPLPNNIADVVISNCVLNLVPDKQKAFREIYRVLKPGGHLSVSDVVLKGNLPEKIQKAAEMYAGCISGAMQMNDYLDCMSRNGLINRKVQKEKQIFIDHEDLQKYLSETEMEEFIHSGAGIFSITVYAEKPLNV